MDTDAERHNPDAQRRELHLGENFTLFGRPGTVVRCLSGQVWITQEGDPNDYVVPEHGRYCSAGRGRIVIGALSETAHVVLQRVEPVPAAYWAGNAVRIDQAFAEAARRAARREMVLWFAGLVSRAWRALRRGRLSGHLRGRDAVLSRGARGYHC